MEIARHRHESAALHRAQQAVGRPALHARSDAGELVRRAASWAAGWLGLRAGDDGGWPRGLDFWRLWMIGCSIFMVRWIEAVALAVFVYRQTGSAFLVALIALLRLVPLGLFGVFLGEMADRMERRTVLLLLVGVNLATSLVMISLALLGSVEVWHIAVASFVYGTVWATDIPVRRMVIGEIVGGERMGTAISIDIGTNNAARMVGPALGGTLLAAFGLHAVFAVSVALNLVALWAIVTVRHRGEQASGAARSGVLVRVLEGIQLARGHRRIAGMFLIGVIFNLFAWPILTLVPVVGQDNFHLGARDIGILASMEGVGAFAGAMVISLYARPSHFAALNRHGVVVYHLALTVFAALPHPALAGTALLIAGLGQSAFSISQTTLIYQAAPPAMRGRMMGVLAAIIGLSPIGVLHIGLLAEALGATWAILISGSEGLLGLFLTRRLWWSMHLDQPAKAQDGAV